MQQLMTSIFQLQVDENEDRVQAVFSRRHEGVGTDWVQGYFFVVPGKITKRHERRTCRRKFLQSFFSFLEELKYVHIEKEQRGREGKFANYCKYMYM